jgi:hypothetical protein
MNENYNDDDDRFVSELFQLLELLELLFSNDSEPFYEQNSLR